MRIWKAREPEVLLEGWSGTWEVRVNWVGGGCCEGLRKVWEEKGGRWVEMGS